MRKVDDGEEKKRKKRKKKKKKIMTFIVATNVIASRPPERRPTGTPQASNFVWYLPQCNGMGKQCQLIKKSEAQILLVQDMLLKKRFAKKIRI